MPSRTINRAVSQQPATASMVVTVSTAQSTFRMTLLPPSVPATLP